MNRYDWLTAGILTAVLVALLLPLAPIGIDPHHDGVMLKPALDVLSGQVLFRDSFTQYGLLTSYLQALALWVSPTLLSIRVLNVLGYAATMLILYTAWRIILPRSLVVAACVLYILFIPAYERNYWQEEYWLLLPWSSVFAMMFQAIGLHALLRVILGQQPERWGLVLGMACACTFWCRQPVGLAMAGSLLVIGVALPWTGWSPATATRRAVLGRLMGGFVAVNGIIFGGLAVNGAMAAWWEQNIIWPARWSEAIEWGITLPLTIHPVAAASLAAGALALAAPTLLRRYLPAPPAFLLPVYFLGLAAGVAWQHEWFWQALMVGKGGWHALVLLVIMVQAGLSIAPALAGRRVARPVEYYQTAALAALALGSLPQYYPMADAWHAFYALSIAFGLFVFCLWRWSGARATTVAAILAAALLPAIYAKAVAIPPALSRPWVTLTKPAVLRGMRVPARQAQDFAGVADTLAMIMRHEPDIPGAMIGNNALYLCLMNNRANPIPYYVTWTGLARQKDNLQRWQYIGAVRPVMILQQAQWEAVNDFYRRSNYVPLLYVSAEALEIAVPRELADRMGVKPYGAQNSAERGMSPKQP